MRREMGYSTKTLMIGFALLIDLALGPAFSFLSMFVLAFIPDAIAAVVFHYWLKKYNIHLFSGGRMFGSWLTVILEAFPTGLLPLWTIRIAILLATPSSSEA